MNRLCQCRKLMVLSHRFFSAKLSNQKVVLTDDESTYIAWHSKPDYAYEYTKPISQDVAIEDKTNSVLNTQLTPELLEIFNKKTPDQARQELMNITYTTKHRWYPRSRDKRAKKTPMDRKYL